MRARRVGVAWRFGRVRRKGRSMPALFEGQAYRSAKILAAMDAVGDAAWTLWSRAILWSNDESTDGFVPTAQLRHLTQHKNPIAVAEALCDCGAGLRKSGLFERTEGGYYIHDFLSHNFSKAEKEAKKQRDRERKGAKTPQGIPTDSARNPDGKSTESATHPSGTPTDSRSIVKDSKTKQNTGAESTRNEPASRREIQTPPLDPHTQARIAYTEAVSAAVGRLWPGIAGFAEEDAAIAALLADAAAEHTAEFGALDLPRFLDKLGENVTRWVREERAAGREKFTRGWRPSKFVEWLAAQDAAQAAPAPRESRWQPPTDAELGLAPKEPATGLVGAPDRRVDA